MNTNSNFSGVKKLVLLVLCVAMFAVVFIPWLSLGIDVEKIGSLKLRAFGFHTWYGIVAAVVAIVAAGGVLCKRYILSLCASILAFVIGFFALSDYPSSRVYVELSDEFETLVESRSNPRLHTSDYYDDYYDDYNSRNNQLESYLGQVTEPIAIYNTLPAFKVPGQIVELISVAVDLVDQGFVYEALEKSGANMEIISEVGEVEVINHRLGAILYLIFAALATLLSGLAFSSSCKKETCATVAE